MKQTQTFPKVWFATEKLINSRTRFVNFSDRGSLRFELKELQFTGRKQLLKITNVQSTRLISPRIPWMSIALSIAVLLVFSGFMLLRVPSEFVLTIISIFIPFLFIVFPFMIFVQKAVLWIEIAFVDEENVLHRAYFLDGSRLILLSG